MVTIPSEKYVQVDQDLIPTGKIADVQDTPLDLRKATMMRDVLALCPGEEYAGFSHCYVVEKNLKTVSGSLLQGETELVVVGTVTDSSTGRGVQCSTDQPGVIFYTGQYNSSAGDMVGREGRVYGKYSGLCLETQKFGDSCNQPSFPSWTLRPGTVYTHNTSYKFFNF